MSSYVAVTLYVQYVQAEIPNLHTTGSTYTFLLISISSPNSLSMKSILKSLAKFQESCPPINRSDKNPFFKSKYAALDSIQNHIKPHLQASGIVVTQAVININDLPYVQTKVWEVESGEYIDSMFPVVVAKQNAQEYGSAVSYAKRYSLTGLLNLIIQDEDDDGNVAAGNGTFSKTSVPVGKSTAVSNTPPELPPLSQEKYDAMVKFINDGKISQVESAIKKYTLTDPQKKLLTTLINQAKSEAVTKAAKK